MGLYVELSHAIKGALESILVPDIDFHYNFVNCYFLLAVDFLG
ncbi:hypothetical protein Patl1_32577 [Pistacia atlantica]|uniref:Uncharacterized protein n=1 Tax=Pistacia atlantica TaxID=434234 RepID=A0ACC1AR02_9ROSI|nr:hypothetical protein Patl1_32577 [Pistacia atlantica]